MCCDDRVVETIVCDTTSSRVRLLATFLTYANGGGIIVKSGIWKIVAGLVALLGAVVTLATSVACAATTNLTFVIAPQISTAVSACPP